MAHSPGEKAEFAENSFPKEITESEISNFRSKFSSVDEAYAQALANRPDFAAAKSRIEASKFSIIASKVDTIQVSLLQVVGVGLIPKSKILIYLEDLLSH